jgi:hypothetical protein
MANLSDFFTGNPVWNRPTHEANRLSIAGGSSCCVCIPNTATRLVVEMWGQGGGGSGGACCSWGCTGGQGGSYANRVWDISGVASAITLCGCGCSCDCRTPISCGHPGQFSRLTDCSGGLGLWIGCVNGGTGGACGCIGATSWVCTSCGCAFNPQFDTGCIKGFTPVTDSLPQFYALCGMSTAQNSACTGGSAACCAGSSCYCALTLCSATCTGTQHCFNNPTICSASATASCNFNTVFPIVNCACFDVYRQGACGWSKANINLGYDSTWNFCDIGVGGAAYAGGAQEKRNFSLGNFAYCGFAGNFPGGGGKSSGVCGGGCCCGSIGGAGLILISWG